MKVEERIDPAKLSSALHVCGGRSSITHDMHHTTLITTFKEKFGKGFPISKKGANFTVYFNGLSSWFLSLQVTVIWGSHRAEVIIRDHDVFGSGGQLQRVLAHAKNRDCLPRPQACTSYRACMLWWSATVEPPVNSSIGPIKTLRKSGLRRCVNH